MNLFLGWPEITIRLLSTAAAGSLIGFNRGEHGRPVGLRTTILVSLTACIAMILANLLLSTSGKKTDSFVSMDVMRLPLGILSGIGFIGAGAIFKHKTLVLGVTTAATLWFVTVTGLCFGSGQIALGWATSIGCLVVLTVLKAIEKKLPRDHRARLAITRTLGGPEEREVQDGLHADGYQILSRATNDNIAQNRRRTTYVLQWRGPIADLSSPSSLCTLVNHPEVVRVVWTPEGD